ncbi:MAG: hypothetical protein GWP91_13975 [Rhodobacterales bacterium]|nr:hypothetical protein [Rhodobacterales bacterium]
MNPYVVPVAGAAWAEWWVEDYIAARVGTQVAPGAFQFALLSDVAWFDGQTEVGFALVSHVQKNRLYADVDVGFAPWIPRPEGQARASLWFALGLDWGPFRKS